MKTVNLLTAIAILVLTQCQPAQQRVIFVDKEQSPKKMGATLIHEHLLVDFIGADSVGYQRWDRDSVIATVLPFLLEAKSRGVETFIDCTPAYLGRDPWLLKKLSELSGVNIMTNTGLYGAVDNK